MYFADQCVNTIKAIVFVHRQLKVNNCKAKSNFSIYHNYVLIPRALLTRFSKNALRRNRAKPHQILVKPRLKTQLDSPPTTMRGCEEYMIKFHCASSQGLR